MDEKLLLKCLWCDRTLSHLKPSDLLAEARSYGWHDINDTAPGGDEPGVTHHGTCPGCIWEHSARGQAVS